MTKKASKEVRSFLSKIGRIGGTTGKGTPKSLDKIRAARAARKAKRQQYPRWEFVTGGCGYGHRDKKRHEYHPFSDDPDAYTVAIKYDRHGSRTPGAKNWVCDTPGAERFSTVKDAKAFAERWASERHLAR
jgi:hypothetical protein